MEVHCSDTHTHTHHTHTTSTTFLLTLSEPYTHVASLWPRQWELVTRDTPWEHLCDDSTSYIEHFEKLDRALRSGARPPIPTAFEAEQSTYVTLMKKCWAQKPQARPSFDVVVALLDVVPTASSQSVVHDAPPERRPERAAAEATAPNMYNTGSHHGSTQESSLGSSLVGGFPLSVTDGDQVTVSMNPVYEGEGDLEL